MSILSINFGNYSFFITLLYYEDVHKRTHAKPEDISTEEDEGNVKDAATSLIDQLRQRLVRMSVRHHELLYTHQQHEAHLLETLNTVGNALEEAISLLNIQGNVFLPATITSAAERFRIAAAIPPPAARVLKPVSVAAEAVDRIPEDSANAVVV